MILSILHNSLCLLHLMGLEIPTTAAARRTDLVNRQHRPDALSLPSRIPTTPRPVRQAIPAPRSTTGRDKYDKSISTYAARSPRKEQAASTPGQSYSVVGDRSRASSHTIANSPFAPRHASSASTASRMVRAASPRGLATPTAKLSIARAGIVNVPRTPLSSLQHTPIRTPQIANGPPPSHSHTASRLIPSSPSKKPSSTSSPVKLANGSSLSAALIRQEAYLLQLSLLLSAADDSSKSYHASFHRSHDRSCADLQAKEDCIKDLESRVLRREQVLRLYDWTGGNTAELKRKVRVLVGVVGEVRDILFPQHHRSTDADRQFDTAPDVEESRVRPTSELLSSPLSNSNEATGSTLEAAEALAERDDAEVEDEDGNLRTYSKLTTAFNAWIAHIRRAWTARDCEAAVSTDASASVAGPEAISPLSTQFKASLRTFEEQLTRLSEKLAGLDETATSPSRPVPRTPKPSRPADVRSMQPGRGVQAATPRAMQSVARTRILTHGEEQPIQEPSTPQASAGVHSVETAGGLPNLASTSKPARSSATVERTAPAIVETLTQLVNDARMALTVMREVEFEVLEGERLYARSMT
ncbi:hypothetical protein MRB53_037021 [Persea americana]|nr:hypothetical protein MRB53_037021 [Persea americana]